MVLFVCPHGAAKSRLAAALFNRVAPADWQATSAGLHPQAAVSVATVHLVAGTDLDPPLDPPPPRPATAGRDAVTRVGLGCDPSHARRWGLGPQPGGAAMLA